jgi:UDP-N-acetyl-D-mannosaminouronate:lipid I N-acetyl-D-mannosaminouronosyltransferase
LTKRTLAPINVGDIPVIPFKSIEHVVDTIFDQNNAIIPNVAIAINPEKIMTSFESSGLRKILLDATIPYADGIGVVKVMEKKTGKKLSRIPGVKLWFQIVKKAHKTNNSIFLVGSKPETIKLCEHKLKTEEGISVVGTVDGYFSNENIVFEKIKNSEAKVVIVALGSPKQEEFIQRCKEYHPNAFYMGVGGSFDVYVGNVKRAPYIWIKLNLEWLYRLISEPKRIFRQYKLLKFLYLFLFNKI